MKHTLIILLLLIMTHVNGQKLNRKTRMLVKQKMDSIKMDDQKYRYQLLLGELDVAKLDSLKKLSHKKFQERIINVGIKKIGFNKQTSDSLWKLQNKLDSINAIKFIEIIAKYGYPSYKRTKSYASSSLSLHLIGNLYFDKLLPIFKKELEIKNMPPNEYARWFDRNNLISKKQQLYGAYHAKYPCVESIEKTNIERKKIGLKPIKKNKCR